MTACAHPAAGAPFALLDDCDASAARPGSRLYTDWRSSLVCEDAATLDDWQRQLHAALAQGLHAVLLADYEWGLQLQGLAHLVDAVPAAPGAVARRPSLRAELFGGLERWSKAEVDAWLVAAAPADAAAGLLAWQPTGDQATFAAQIDQIHAAIERGDTYQVNHTFALRGLGYGTPLALYRRLRERQPAQYGALIRRPGAAAAEPSDEWILSLSPELFLQVRGRQVMARPMKGTAPVGADAAATQAMAEWLRGDPKNRAENVMIVDLLRNDLGRIARTGSVQVRDAFAVQQNGRVLSMTSTVEAALRPEVGIADVLRSSFPCGSITGAPKRKTMELIAQIEGQVREPDGQPYRRGLYTGAIGWVQRSEARPAAAGAAPSTTATAIPELDYCLSVPIRTLLLREGQGGGGAHAVRLPVGAGIVWDSRAGSEWQECQLKARFATQGMAGFELFETMRLEPGAALPERWTRHMARLQASAQALGFAHDAAGWQAQLRDYLAVHSPAQPAHRPVWRLRMALREDGALAFTHGVLAPLNGPQPVTLQLREQPCRTPAWLRRHKTTLRSDYDAAMRDAEAAGAFDCLFFNAAGHLTEGARSNVLVRLEDGPQAPWLTPPLSDGVLPGVMRAALLDDPDWCVREQSLTRAQLLAAREIVVCNALRGVLSARLQP